MRELPDATGVACCRTTEAIVRTLDAVGARRVCVASPYPEEIDDRERTFLEACGIQVTGIVSLDIADSRELADPSPGEIYRLGRAAWVPGSDALLVSCLALRSHFVAQQRETDLGTPVVASTQATLWAVLRRTGSATRSLDAAACPSWRTCPRARRSTRRSGTRDDSTARMGQGTLTRVLRRL